MHTWGAAGPYISIQNAVVQGTAGEDDDPPCVSDIYRVAKFTCGAVNPGLFL